MQGKNKYRIKGSGDFLRYHGDKMDDRERNAFEKSLQQDPFAEEASEGFAGIDPELAGHDLAELKSRLDRKVIGKPDYLWYRVAASIAAVLILALVFRFNREEKTSEQAGTPSEPQGVIESPMITQNNLKSEISNPKSEIVNIESPVITDEKQESAVIKNQMAVATERKEKLKAPQRSSETLVKTEPVPEVMEVNEQEAEFTEVTAAAAEAAPPVRAEKAEYLPLNRDIVPRGQSPAVKGKIISAEDHQPLPGVAINVKGTSQGVVTDSGGNFKIEVQNPGDKSFVASYIGMEPKEFKANEDTGVLISLNPSPMALNEMVVVGYGAKKQAKSDAESPEDYTPAQPVNGKTEFDRYIRDNMRRPDSSPSGQRVVVVLRFAVEKRGKPDSISVLRSPGKPFTNEAIRLLREGPEWIPALQNGVAKTEEVTVRIVFK